MVSTIHYVVPSACILDFYRLVMRWRKVACVAGVERGRGRGNLGARESVWGARGRKERNACKDAIVLAVFYAQILSVKIVIGQN